MVRLTYIYEQRGSHVVESSYLMNGFSFHSTIGSPLKLELLGVAYGMGLALVCYACCFFAMVAMNLKDHEFGLKISFRYQRFEL